MRTGVPRAAGPGLCHPDLSVAVPMCERAFVSLCEGTHLGEGFDSHVCAPTNVSTLRCVKMSQCMYILVHTYMPGLVSLCV